LNAKLEFYIRGQYLRRRDEMFLYQRDSVKAKAALYVITDVEGRRHREQKGLDTLVVFADNDERYRLDCYFDVCPTVGQSLIFLDYK
jgi:hypothetical protein